MTWENFRGKNVALLGAGIENLSLVPHLKKANATIFVCEQNPEAISEDLRFHHPELKFVSGPDHLKKLGRYHFVFRSPGLPIERIDQALKGVQEPPVVSTAINLFLELTKSKTIGVTGTKGKGTTSTLIGAMLEAAGHKTVVAGNIGKPVFTVFDDLDEDTYVVLELSSFQLEDLEHSPTAAVVLPITSEHLQPLSEASPNFHKSINDYVAAKAHITLHQTGDNLLVFAADSPESTAIASVSKAKKVAVSQNAYQSHWNVDANGNVYRQGDPYIDLQELNLRGRHVYLNVTMALAVTSELGVRRGEQIEAIKKFKPLPHRLEDIGTYEGVRYVDDSYATAPDATIAALTAFEEPIVLIAGGSSKGMEFAELADKIVDSTVKGVVLIGQEAVKIKQALTERAPKLPITDGGSSMASAVAAARSLASAGDVILLSPACASKDMFKSAADRGEQFQRVARIDEL